MTWTMLGHQAPPGTTKRRPVQQQLATDLRVAVGRRQVQRRPLRSAAHHVAAETGREQQIHHLLLPVLAWRVEEGWLRVGG